MNCFEISRRNVIFYNQRVKSPNWNQTQFIWGIKRKKEKREERKEGKENTFELALYNFLGPPDIGGDVNT